MPKAEFTRVRGTMRHFITRLQCQIDLMCEDDKQFAGITQYQDRCNGQLAYQLNESLAKIIVVRFDVLRPKKPTPITNCVIETSERCLARRISYPMCLQAGGVWIKSSTGTTGHLHKVSLPE